MLELLEKHLLKPKVYSIFTRTLGYAYSLPELHFVISTVTRLAHAPVFFLDNRLVHQVATMAQPNLTLKNKKTLNNNNLWETTITIDGHVDKNLNEKTMVSFTKHTHK